MEHVLIVISDTHVVTQYNKEILEGLALHSFSIVHCEKWNTDSWYVEPPSDMWIGL